MLAQCGKKTDAFFYRVINICLSSCRTYNPKIVEQLYGAQNKTRSQPYQSSFRV
jgi:hypothetical protein